MNAQIDENVFKRVLWLYGLYSLLNLLSFCLAIIYYPKVSCVVVHIRQLVRLLLQQHRFGVSLVLPCYSILAQSLLFEYWLTFNN